MIFSVLTLFPGIFESPLSESIIKKAADKGAVRFNVVNIRDFAEDIHRTCDDSPLWRRSRYGHEGRADL